MVELVLTMVVVEVAVVVVEVTVVTIDFLPSSFLFSQVLMHRRRPLSTNVLFQLFVVIVITIGGVFLVVVMLFVLFVIHVIYISLRLIPVWEQLQAKPDKCSLLLLQGLYGSLFADDIGYNCALKYVFVTFHYVLLCVLTNSAQTIRVLI